MMAVRGICKLCLHFCFQIQELKPTFEVLCVQLCTDVITVLLDNVFVFTCLCAILLICVITDAFMWTFISLCFDAMFAIIIIQWHIARGH